MGIARKHQISLEHTPYYHCTSRCVRRAFLCGKDCYSGQDFEHRRRWLVERLAVLSDVFAIDLLAYAVMSNHYHVVLCVDADTAASWSEAEVIERWGRLYALPAFPVTATVVATWRERLMSLSWYMRAVNEPLARRANREDRCTGRFWEGRFKCQALLDETALLKCMSYVDLNPIRAGIATTPESSEYTSVKASIDGDADHLLPFTNGEATGIPLHLDDYLSLVDWSGRALRQDKRGAIPANIPSILSRLAIKPDTWAREMRHYGCWYYHAVGSAQELRAYCEHLGQRWLKGGLPIHAR